MKTYYTNLNQQDKLFSLLEDRAKSSSADITVIIRNIIEDIRTRGDKALFEYSEKFDKYRPSSLVMSQEEIEALYDKHKLDTVQNTETSVEENTSQENETEESSEEDTTEENLTQETILEEEKSGYQGPVDFEGMWKVNKDVYAWITVPGTVIDYPILQHKTDNTYYLNYNIDGSYGYPGCIYTENMNSKDFTDNNTVIYGHNMKNGTMFAGLHKYEDASFFEKYDKIYIYTPEKTLEYTIFAAYVYDDRHLLYSFDFSDSAVYANYLKTVQGMRSMNANLRSDITVTAKDKIITLVTCMSKQPEKRLLVQAVLN